MSTLKLLPAYQFNELLKQFKLKHAPRCVQKVVVEHRGRNNVLGNKCGNIAKIEIDGKQMCVRHAQQYALAKLLSESKK